MFSRIITRNMSNMTINLNIKVDKAEKLVAELKTKLDEVKNHKVEIKIKDLVKENEILLKKVEHAKEELIRLETLHGKKQYPLPGRTVTNVIVAEQIKPKEDVPPIVKKEKKEKENKKIKESQPQATSDAIIDIRKLDLRIGKIVEISKHPDADSLYVEKILCGEENPRTVVSGLVNHMPIEEMRDRLVMVLCNLKPVKMRGVTSEAMVMCASTPEKVEVLMPPSGSTPGDLVTCEGYPREPEAQLNPKKKIFETCAPDLKTNEDNIACYKDSPLVVSGKGPVKSPTLKGANIK